MRVKEGYKLWLRTIFLAIFAAMFLFSCSAMVHAQEKQKEKPVFVTVIYPTEWSETNALLLVESIRAFAGVLSQAPIWCYLPRYGKKLSSPTEERLAELNAKVIPYDIDMEVVRFFFAADIRAAYLAESTAIGKADLIIWLGSNTIILKEPRAFLLEDGKNLGYRPVHHKNVGIDYDTPLDPFWKTIYEYCQVPEERVFPMTTHIDAQTIRPYFNAGILVTRPEEKLFKEWHDIFFRVYQIPEMQELYKQNERYVIFAHQAILSGITLHKFPKDEILELPKTYNYPIHLYDDDVTADRPSSLEQLVTIRHEGFYRDPDWMTKMPAGDSLKQWLARTLSR